MIVFAGCDVENLGGDCCSVVEVDVVEAGFSRWGSLVVVDGGGAGAFDLNNLPRPHIMNYICMCVCICVMASCGGAQRHLYTASGSRLKHLH